jgi:hypothetical protein
MNDKELTAQQKRRTLVLHIGLPKTGTSTIQHYLNTFTAHFENHGIGSQAMEGGAAHYQLTHQLRSLDGLQIHPKGYFSTPPDDGVRFPQWGNNNKYILSCEDLCTIGEKGVLSVEQHSETSKADLHIVCTLRNPKDWLWSAWTQISKFSDTDWASLVAFATDSKEGFLSRVINPWLTCQNAKITFINYQCPDLFHEFLTKIEIDKSIHPSTGPIEKINSGDDIALCMYRSLLSKLVIANIKNLSRLQFERPDDGLIKQSLLDLSEIGSPAHEIAIKNSNNIESIDNIKILGNDSFPELATYLEYWLADTNEFLLANDTRLSKDSKDVVKFLVEQVENDIDSLNNSPQDCRLFPQKDFAENLPIDSQFVGLARSIATLITLQSRSIKAGR